MRDGGKLILIQLRQGVLFHNGKEMTSDDAAASLNRCKFGARAPALFQQVERVSADREVRRSLHLKDSFAPWATLLAYANGGPTIYPKEIMETATKEPIPPKDYIGTGPYRFVEWKAGHEIILERFDKYVKRTEKADGYAGERMAYFDKIVFVPVSDPGTRVNGIKAGEYDYAERLPGDLFEGLDKDPSVRTMIRKAAGFGELFFNQKEGMMRNQKLRQAILAAINMEPALESSFGTKKLWAVNGALMSPGTKWYTKAGTEGYSQNNPTKAKALAKEAGYKGEPIRYMVTTSYSDHYAASVVLTKQLKDAGFNIDLQIYDWATLVSDARSPPSGTCFTPTTASRPIRCSSPSWLRPTLAGGIPRTSGSTWRSTRPSPTRPSACRPWRSSRTLLRGRSPARTGDSFTYDIFAPRSRGSAAPRS